MRTVLVVVVLLVTAVRGEAAPCGDADASGGVSVSDGVNVLRAAAGLSTTCTMLPLCDVDGNGTVTVTDGVNVLRTAAGLAADLHCACGAAGCTGIDADVQAIAADLFPFLAGMDLFLTPFTVKPYTGAPLCPDGGSRVVDDSGTEVFLAVTMDACTVAEKPIGHFRYDGTVVIRSLGLGPSPIDFDFRTTDVAHGNREVAFSGTLSVEVTGSSLYLAGPLVVTTPEHAFTFDLVPGLLAHPTTIGIPSGASVTDDDGAFTFAVLSVTTVPDSLADLRVTFDDATVHTYVLDLTSGRLTQTS